MPRPRTTVTRSREQLSTGERYGSARSVVSIGAGSKCEPNKETRTGYHDNPYGTGVSQAVGVPFSSTVR